MLQLYQAFGTISEVENENCTNIMLVLIYFIMQKELSSSLK